MSPVTPSSLYILQSTWSALSFKIKKPILFETFFHSSEPPSYMYKNYNFQAKHFVENDLLMKIAKSKLLVKVSCFTVCVAKTTEKFQLTRTLYSKLL